MTSIWRKSGCVPSIDPEARPPGELRCLRTVSLTNRILAAMVAGIALILGVDRLLDMVRAVVNVTGDVVVTLIVARGEGHLDEEVFNRSDGPDPAELLSG